jgi:hypothetical protein
VFQRGGSIARKFMRVHRVAVVFLLLIIAVAAVLIAAASGTPQVVAGIAALLASAGVTWKAVSTAVGNVAAEIGRPLWAAEIDLALAKAITKLPPDEPQNTYPAPGPQTAGPAQVTAPAPSRVQAAVRRVKQVMHRESKPPMPDWEKIVAEHPSSR